MNMRYCLLLLFSLNVVTASTAQTVSPDKQVEKMAGLQDSLSTLANFPNRYFTQVSAKADKLNRRITKRTGKALRRLQKQEEKINRKLGRVDQATRLAGSLASDNFLTHSIDSLAHLRDALQGKANQLTGKIPGSNYIPYLDTLKNALHFFDKTRLPIDKYSGQVKKMQDKIQSSLGSVQQLESRMRQVGQIQQYISRQKQLLQQELSQPAFANILSGKYGKVLKKHLEKIGKEAYYYKAQLQNYKELWQQPDKLERKALSMLHKLPAFSDFMKKHSALASLFNIAGSETGDLQEEDLAGLQTRAMVQQELQQRLQSGGTDSRARIQQQMARARQKLKELKNKLPGGGSTADMPNFKPKDLKSRTLFQRLEFGGNIQFSKPARFSSISGVQIPTISDIAGQVAYKFSEKGSVGIGAAFKLGWGNPFGRAQGAGKIHFTAQGAGLRSFIDYKLKGTIYINGGFEMNYNKTIPNIPELKNLNGWTSSALLGIEKKYKISPSTGSGHRGLKGTMMLLFDFLYKQHIPQTQPVVFRVGYNF